LKAGIVGYFKAGKDKLIIQHFLVTAHDCGKYHIYELKMTGDSIEGYKKIKVEGLKGVPDW
jgi:hypothetical protein